MVRFTPLILIALLAALPCGCSNHAARNTAAITTAPSDSQPQASPALLTEDPSVGERRAAEWEDYLANPGEPGVDFDPGRVMVRFINENAAVTALATSTVAEDLAAGGRNAILRENRVYEGLAGEIALDYGLELETQVYIGKLNLAAYRVPAGVDAATTLSRIRSDYKNYIQYAAYPPLARASYAVNDPHYLESTATTGEQWGHVRIGCTEAWDYTLGDPAVMLAVVDTGCNLDHEELGNILVPSEAFPGETLDIANDDNTVEDLVWHGSFIAGIVGAEGNNGRTIIGVAPDTPVIPIKISNEGTTPTSMMVEGSLLGMALGAKVVNLSWGTYAADPGLESMVNTLTENDVLFVSGAGNDSLTADYYPSAFVNCLSVAWSGHNDERTGTPGTGGGNYGDTVDLTAPGEDLLSCGPSRVDQYGHADGSSFSAPMTAAAACMLYSIDPELTIPEVRHLLETTGAPTTGFSETNPPLRLDIAAAMRELLPFEVVPEPLNKITYGANISVMPTVHGDAESLDISLNGSLATQLYGEPWAATLDLSGITFGHSTIQYDAHLGGETTSASSTLLVDNTIGVFPLQDGFEPGEAAGFLPIDLRHFSPGVLTAVKQLESGWTYGNITAGGSGGWLTTTGNPYSGTTALYCGIGGSYDPFETDALVSRLLDFTGVTNPTLVFQHGYNIEDGDNANDRGSVLVSADGVTWEIAPLESGEEAMFTGYQDGWVQARIDLSAWAGQQVRLALVFESNGSIAGEQEFSPAGWWVDDLAIAINYQETAPQIDAVSLEPGTVIGAVPGLTAVPLSVTNPQRVATLSYRLDLAPLGEDTGEDILIDLDAMPFSTSLDLPEPAVVNQQAVLYVDYEDASGNPGQPFAIPVWIFNHPGDVDADGLVDQADSNAYSTVLGLSADDPGYIPFFDTDLDGMITEGDASGVGYHWGG